MLHIARNLMFLLLLFLFIKTNFALEALGRIILFHLSFFVSSLVLDLGVLLFKEAIDLLFQKDQQVFDKFYFCALAIERFEDSKSYLFALFISVFRKYRSIVFSATMCRLES